MPEPDAPGPRSLTDALDRLSAGLAISRQFGRGRLVAVPDAPALPRPAARENTVCRVRTPASPEGIDAMEGSVLARAGLLRIPDPVRLFTLSFDDVRAALTDYPRA